PGVATRRRPHTRRAPCRARPAAGENRSSSLDASLTSPPVPGKVQLSGTHLTPSNSPEPLFMLQAGSRLGRADHFWRRTIAPDLSWPTTWKVFLAMSMSMPTTAIHDWLVLLGMGCSYRWQPLGAFASA